MKIRKLADELRALILDTVDQGVNLNDSWKQQFIMNTVRDTLLDASMSPDQSGGNYEEDLNRVKDMIRLAANSAGRRAEERQNSEYAFNRAYTSFYHRYQLILDYPELVEGLVTGDINLSFALLTAMKLAQQKVNRLSELAAEI